MLSRPPRAARHVYPDPPPADQLNNAVNNARHTPRENPKMEMNVDPRVVDSYHAFFDRYLEDMPVNTRNAYKPKWAEWRV